MSYCTFGSCTKQQIQIKITKLLAEVCHNICSDVFIVIITLAQTTVLILSRYTTFWSNVCIGFSSILVITYACRNIPPVSNLQRSISSTCKTVSIVIQLVLVDNPIWVFLIITKFPNTVKQTILATVFIQILRHVFCLWPAIKSSHGTVTTTTVQTTRCQSLVSLSL